MPLSPSGRALGDLLVGRRVITLPRPDEGVEPAKRWNVRRGDALPLRNWINPRLYCNLRADLTCRSSTGFASRRTAPC